MRIQSIGCLVLAIACCLLTARFFKSDGSSFLTAPDVSWRAPSQLALNNLGPAHPAALGMRRACTHLTYRMIDDRSKTMHDGCFIETAFGRVDPAGPVVIFNGSDEAEYIKEGSRLPALQPLPYSGSMIRFGGFPNQGSYMYIYRDFYGGLMTQGSPLSGGRYKAMTKTSDFVVRDSSGALLNVNPLTFALAARSQWFVAEVPNKALVRVSLADFSVLPFAPSLHIPNLPNDSRTAAMAVTPNGRYTAIASGRYKTFRVYDLKHCSAPPANSPTLQPQDCPSFDYWNFLQQQVGATITSIDHLDFTGDGLLRFNVKTAGGYETYLLSPAGPITSLIPYLGIGDSYASGQGAFNYLTGTDTAVNKCHLSVNSYPLRLSRTLFAGNGQSVACSGARSHDVASNALDYKGQSAEQQTARAREADGSEVSILHDFKAGYLAQQRFVTSYQPGAITVQIGGNDIGFGTMLLRCLSPVARIKPPTLNPNDCYQTYEDRLEIVNAVNRTYPKLVSLYRQLQEQSPVSKLYVIGYPHIVSPNAQCRLNVHLTLAEIRFAREVVDYINDVIRRAASASGVRFVDVHDAFLNRELCSGSRGQLAVNGLTAGDDEFGLGQESFHPNAYGHELLEQAILRQTDNLRAANGTVPSAATPPTVDPDQPLLQKPPSGRVVKNISYQPISPRVVNRGTTTTITIDGPAAGVKPGTPYRIIIGDTDAGTITSDENGNISGTIPVPEGVEAGIQPIIVTGPGQGETPIDIIDTVYVPVDPDDADGDDIPNEDDPCPLAVGEGCEMPTVDTGAPVVSEPTTPSSPVTDVPAPPSDPALEPKPSESITNDIVSTASPQVVSGGVLIQSASSSVGQRVLSGSKLAAAVRPVLKTGSAAPGSGAVLGARQSTRPANATVVEPLGIFRWYVWAGLWLASVAVYSGVRWRQERGAR